MVGKLEHSDEGVRKAAVETLGKLAPEALTAHAAALVAKLKDSSDVRELAMETLRKLAPEDLALLGDAVVQQLHSRRAPKRARRH